MSLCLHFFNKIRHEPLKLILSPSDNETTGEMGIDSFSPCGTGTVDEGILEYLFIGN